MQRGREWHEGDVFDGRFEIQEEIGAGSFGRVYRARQLTTGQLVAIKTLRWFEELPETQAAAQIARFQREKALCAELAHPNLVTLIDAGETPEGDVYAVFAYVPGMNLADLLAREGALAPRETLRIMLQVLDALAALHRQGVIHRDLKPSNLMVSGTGALRNATLLDLGLGGFAQARRDRMARLTQSREMMGTPLYAAPEQLYGAPASESSDLYAWGIVFLECLAGRHPYADELGPGASLLRQASAPLPPGLRRHPLGQMLVRVTHPDAERRPGDAASLVSELEQIDAAELERLLGRSRVSVETSARRPLTIVSCRVLIEEPEVADLEDRDALLRRIHTVCSEVASRHGGRLDLKLGDRVVLHFGYPVAHEFDARRASMAALEIAERIPRCPDPETADLRASAHVGVHTGPVITREVTAPGGLRVPEVVGATPELATQLADLAGPGEVLASETTCRLVGPSLVPVSVGTRRLPGFSRALPVYRLERGTTDPSAVADRSAFVGRRNELRQLRETFERVAEGQPGCVVVRGEAGIGKTRLVHELHRHLGRGRWLECRCVEESADTPLHPIVDLLRSLDEPMDELVTRYGFEPSSAVPLLHGLLGLPEDPRFPRARLSPERESFLLQQTLVALLLEVSSEEPTVLAIEDLHWADPTTRTLIAQLLGAMRQPGPARPARLLLLGTTRNWSPDEATVLSLPALLPTEVAELVSSGLEPERRPDEELLRHIVERADGVPLYVEEVVRALREAGSDGARSRSAIPDTLEALLQVRLDALSESARELTEIGAVLGREFDEQLLRLLAEDELEAIDADLIELCRGGFLLARPAPRGTRYVFRHALIREAAYEAILRPRRRELHARAGDVLERALPERSEQEPQLVAQHRHAAGQYAAAARAYLAAGRRALERAAYGEAIAQLQKGLRSLERLPVTAQRRRQEVELLESLGMAHYSSSGYSGPHVEETFRRAEAICEELGQEMPLQTLYGIWSVRFTQGDVAATASIVERMQRLAARGEEPLGRLYAHGVRGLRAGVLGDLALADEQLALSTAECEAPANFSHLHALPYGGPVHPPGWWSWFVCLRGQPDRARGIGERMRSIAEKLGNAYGFAVSGHFSSLLAQELGDVAATRSLAERQIAFSAEQQITLWLLCSQCIHGWARALQGEAEEGVQQMEQSLAVVRAVGVVSAMSTFYSLLGEARLAAGDAEGALAAVAEGIGLADTSLDHFYVGKLLLVRSRILRAQADSEGADDALRESLTVARRQGARWIELQALTELVGTRPHRDARGEARAALAGLLDGWEEGSDTGPVRAARAALAATDEPS